MSNIIEDALNMVYGLMPSQSFNYSFPERVQAAAPTSTNNPNLAPTPPPATTPTSSSSANPQADLAQQILQGYRNYSGGKPVPMEQYIPQMVEAAQKYPIFQKYPGLIPATSIVETSAGQNWQQQNNPVSWGVRATWAGDYKPQSSQQAIGDMITAVGGDPNRGQGYDPATAASRMQTASYYDKFRNSADLKDFAQTYDSGNPNYYPALVNAMKYFNGIGGQTATK